MSENPIKKIQIDYRETKRIDNATKYYHRCNPSVARLEHGDFLFTGTDGTQVLFEYKTAQDFFSSLKNNHLHNQTLRASEEYKYQFVIIQSKSLEESAMRYFYESGITATSEQINGAIASLNRFTTVLRADTEEDCFDLMLRQATKIIEDKPLLYKFSKKDPNPAINFFNGCMGLKDKATIICEELNLYSLRDILNVTEDDLLTIEGIGKKTAKKIMSYIGE